MYKNFLTFIIYGFKNFHNAYNVAALDLSLKYRRTIIGNGWSVLTNLITVSIISLVWAVIFNLEIKEYFPKVFIGFTTFYFITSFITGSSDILYGKYKGIILSLGVGLNIIILRHLIFLVLEYLLFIPIYILIILILGNNISLSIFLLIPGLILIIINGYWLTFIFSLLSARFRDFALFISSIMGAAFLLTPILWDKELLGKHENFVYLNPLTSMIEVIRDPLMAKPVNPIIYLVLLLSILIGFFICSIFYKYKKKLFNFWL